MTHRVLTTLCELGELQGNWPAARGRRTVPTQEFAWIEAAATTLLDGDELHIVVAETDGARAVAPLVLRTDLDRLEFLGLDAVGETMDFAYEDKHVLAQLAQGLVELEKPMFLGRLPRDSATPRALRKAFRGRALSVTRAATPSLSVKLDADWRDPLACLGKRTRSSMRRARRRADEMGPVEIKIVRPTPEELPPLLEMAWAVEAKGWKGRRGSALQSSPVGVFFRRYLATLAHARRLWMGFLLIGDRVAAMHFGVELGNRFWSLKTGYDESVSRAAPGKLLTLATVTDAAEHAHDAVELMGDPAPWKREWANETAENVALAIYPYRSARSAVAFAFDAYGSLRRRFLSALSEPKGRSGPR